MKYKYPYSSSEFRAIGERKPSYHTFDAKNSDIQNLINEATHILDSFGVPIEDKTARKIEKQALVFLALCDVKSSAEWSKAKSLREEYSLRTRDVIDYINENFGESISSGSYDDIRRQDLKHPILAGIVVPDRPSSARNDPKRAWAIHSDYVDLIRTYPLPGWEGRVSQFLDGKITLREELAVERVLAKIPVKLPSGDDLEFGLGEHNLLQKEIIEEFMPRYGYGAEVIYVGDAEDKFLWYNKVAAREIGLADLLHDELPDIVAYSRSKNWLYLIEAVHSSGPMSAERIMTLKPLVANCTASTIYITAFLDRATFRKFIADIAWETEVWIASDPDHIIHFDGEKFLGPYQSGAA